MDDDDDDDDDEEEEASLSDGRKTRTTSKANKKHTRDVQGRSTRGHVAITTILELPIAFWRRGRCGGRRITNEFELGD